MNKEEYQEAKQAFNITINGCGENCLQCHRTTCLADNKRIRRAAQRWVAQKEYERKFYHNHREARLSNATCYYHEVRKHKTTPKGKWATNQQSFDLLPMEFTYEEAAKIWQITKNAAIERVKAHLRNNPHALTKHKTGQRCGLIKLRKAIT